ncbi:MAG: 16S rRNA (cytidine(1402)-2'-O)-methyltransferase [Gemmatimonadaceae bacterium]|nr:16S rRNA (cytidine(1402)-2'-O)-methyltransferase [Gemmatimonadaceae bacterium]MCW5827382.1 16S rRNA (cytidine(1402)-2'-O)-methyltransferase [Gemmatimonadaceae bacterium]
MSADGASTPGTLYIVSTPIGNLGDMTPRAVEVLQQVAAVLAEDTRHTRVLCERFAIRTPLLAYHEHNEAQATPGLVARLVAGESLALVSDAGTPLLSDPGLRLVQAAIAAGVQVSAVPGASALLAALAGAGLATGRFTFFGFLPRKGGERTRVLGEVVALAHTAVLYEAPSRLAATLADLAAAGAGERATVVARELTKQYEEFRRGTVAELAAYYADHEPRGEIVIVLDGAPDGAPDEGALRARAAELRAAGKGAREIQQALLAAGASRNVAYRLAHEA